jgi:hypothetical protein
MRLFAAAWEQVFGLLVEDGQMAIGTLLAFASSAVFAYLAGDGIRDLAGWLLFILLMAVLLFNLYRTGRRALGNRSDGSRDGLAHPPAKRTASLIQRHNG